MEEALQRLEDDTVETKAVQAEDITSYRYGDEILKEGEECASFFVILGGQVRLSHRGKKIRVLDDQDIFGLESFIFKKPSYYSARALSRCRIAKYGAEALDHVMRESPRMALSLLVSTLQQLTQTTHNLLEDAQAFSMDDVRVSFFKDDEIIIEEGSQGAEFYRLVSTQGGLRVTIAGQEVSRIEKPGEFFGEIAGLLNMPRQATVASMGESAVEVYSIDDLDVIIRDYPDVALQMMRTLVSRLVDANRRLTGVYL
jgi:CRP-like cAMP-binding protein